MYHLETMEKISPHAKMNGTFNRISQFQDNFVMPYFMGNMFSAEDPAGSRSVIQATDDLLELVNGRDLFDLTTTMDGENCADAAALSEDGLCPTPIDSARIQIVDSLHLKDTPFQGPESLAEVIGQLFSRQDNIFPPENISFSNDAMAFQDSFFPALTTSPSTSSASPGSGLPSSQSKRKINQEFDLLPRQQVKRQRIASPEESSTVDEDGCESSCSPSSETSSSTVQSSQRGPFVSQLHSSQWQENYEALCRFQEKHGHCIVPPRYNNDPTLWRWIKRQRYQYKLKQEGRITNAISDERIAALERISFVWDSQGTLWMDRLDELEEYRSIHGHCNVPSKYPTNSKLSTWVKCQRRQYKLYREGGKSNMNPERIEALNNLGFVFDPRAELKTSKNQ